MKNIDIIAACSDLGVHVNGTNLGPDKLINNIKNKNKINTIKKITYDINYKKELEKNNLKKNLNAVNKFNKKLYNSVLESVNNTIFPITIGGDHSIAIGSALASIKKEKNLGIIWIDAHADYNTFDSTITGNLHGLPLATINGLNNGLSFFHNDKYYDPKKTVIVGYRSEETNKEDEIQNLKSAGVTFFTTEELRKYGIKDIIKKAFEIASFNYTNKVHISYDLDFIDPQVAPGVNIPEINGVNELEAFEVANEVLNYKNQISSFDLVEFNPLNDINKKTEKIASHILNELIEKL